MKSKLTKLMMAFVLVISLVAGVIPQQSTFAAEAEKIDAKSALAIDAETGKIFLNQDADQVLPIASMTKILTLLIVREQIAAKKLSFDDKITVIKEVSDLSQDKGLSNVPLTAGQQYTVKELYDSAWIYSSNAAAHLLAAKVAGSQTKFVDLMKKRLKKLGITDAKIVNVSGLNNSDLPESLRAKNTAANAENEMSAKDLALVAQTLLKKFPETLEITKISTQTFDKGGVDEFEMTSFNRMLPGQPDAFADLTVDGLKTGTTDAAGESFVGTTKKNGFRIITVVMNAGGDADDKGKRFKKTATVMRYVYDNWTKTEVYPAGDTKVAKPVTLRYGKEKSVKVATKSPVVAFVQNDTTAKTTVKMNNNKDLNSTKKGQVLGYVQIADDGLGYLQAKDDKVALVATKTVKEKNIFERLGQGIGEFFGGLF